MHGLCDDLQRPSSDDGLPEEDTGGPSRAGRHPAGSRLSGECDGGGLWLESGDGAHVGGRGRCALCVGASSSGPGGVPVLAARASGRDARPLAEGDGVDGDGADGERPAVVGWRGQRPSGQGPHAPACRQDAGLRPAGGSAGGRGRTGRLCQCLPGRPYLAPWKAPRTPAPGALGTGRHRPGGQAVRARSHGGRGAPPGAGRRSGPG